MNLQVNLILDTEQRSGSVLSVRSLLRILSIVLPLIALVVLVSAILNLMTLRSKQRLFEAKWADAEPKMNKALALAEELTQNRALLEELQGWNASHLDWHTQLAGLRDVVPVTIQLDRLRVSQTLQLSPGKKGEAEAATPTGPPVRAFALTMSGRALGESAEQDIQFLKRGMESAPAFTGIVSSVKVTKYGEDTAKGAGPNDRVFQIDSIYEPRAFK